MESSTSIGEDVEAFPRVALKNNFKILPISLKQQLLIARGGNILQNHSLVVCFNAFIQLFRICRGQFKV